jgi:hypothetical protein
VIFNEQTVYSLCNNDLMSTLCVEPSAQQQTERQVMTENAPRESAKIYQFPIGGRAGLAIQRGGSASVSALKPAQAVTAVACGSLYHDDAIRQEAELVRKR